MENTVRHIGKIIRVSKNGWGFISCKEIPFTRIFFHWTSLNQDTIHFLEVKKGMSVEFTPQETPDRGWRAIKIDVLEDEDEIVDVKEVSK